MIIRYPIKCKTCGKPHQTRVSVGHRAKSVFSFGCRGCTIPITLTLFVDQAAVNTWIEAGENCEEGQGTDGEIVNLHPDFLLPSDKIGDPMYFPTDIVRNVHLSAEAAYKDIQTRRDVTKLLMQDKDIEEEIQKRLKALTLAQAGRSELARSTLGESDNYIYYLNPHGDRYLCHVIDIGIALSCPALHERFLKIRSFYSNVKKKRGFGDAAAYLAVTQNDRMAKFISALRRFASCYNELAKVQYYIRLGMTIPDSFASASPGFDEICKLYGDGFEDVMDLALVPAILNNVKFRGDYTKFATMDLNKYLTIDKAGKMECFMGNDKLSHLMDNVDSSIRNGSHHGSIGMNQGRNMVIYKSGRPPTDKELPYQLYLRKCYELHMDIFHLFACEAFLLQKIG